MRERQATKRDKSERPAAAAVFGLAALGGLVVHGLVGLVFVRIFWLEPYRVPAASMVPALMVGEYFLVDKRVDDVARGDVVIFEFPQDRRLDYVKRVIGLPGEQIELRDGVVYIDGSPLERTLVDEIGWHDDRCTAHRADRLEERAGDKSWKVLQSKTMPSYLGDYGPQQIPADHYFMLGDNRDNSADSRIWGTVPADHLVGRYSRSLIHFDPC